MADRTATTADNDFLEIEVTKEEALERYTRLQAALTHEYCLAEQPRTEHKGMVAECPPCQSNMFRWRLTWANLFYAGFMAAEEMKAVR